MKKVYIQLIDIDEEFEHNYEVKSTNFFKTLKGSSGRKIYHPEGLFSEQIFGPIKDYQCQCGRYKGREYEGKICEICNVLVTSSDVRRETFGKIKLPHNLYVINPIPFSILKPLLAKHVKKTYKDYNKSYTIENIITDYTESILYSIDKETGDIEYHDIGRDYLVSGEFFREISKNKELKAKKFFGIGPEFIRKALEILEKIDPTIKNFNEQFGKFLFISTIPVLPPKLRPLIKIGNNKYYPGKINEAYNHIIHQVNTLKDVFIFKDVRITPLAIIQINVFNVYKLIMDKFGKKKGIIRKHLLGKRVDYSGRAVMTVNPELKLGYVILPLEIARELFGILIFQELASKLNLSIYDAISQNILHDTEYDELILEILNKNFQGYTVLLNRQPTLHRPSFTALKIEKIIKGEVMQMHPLSTSPLNLDFDGDSVYGDVSLIVKLNNGKKKKIKSNIIDLYKIEI